MWSVGLFVATFYSLFSLEGEAFNFSGKELLPISMLANSNVVGWGLFVTSWLALTVLKYQTTEGERVPYPVTED